MLLELVLQALSCHLSEKYMRKGRQMKVKEEDNKEGQNIPKLRHHPTLPTHCLSPCLS